MIRIGIYGFGNLGKAAQWAISQTDDLVLSAVFTRRNPSEIVLADPSVPVLPSSSVREWKGKLDLLLVCGGSAKDLPEMTPALAKDFCVVDSFDTHANIPVHFANVNESAIQGGTLALMHRQGPAGSDWLIASSAHSPVFSLFQIPESGNAKRLQD